MEISNEEFLEKLPKEAVSYNKFYAQYLHHVATGQTEEEAKVNLVKKLLQRKVIE